MAHVLILGMTESGKTTLATELAGAYHKTGFNVIVLDAMRDPRWPGEHVYSDREQFLEVVTNSRRCMIFVDEAGEAVGQYEKEMFWLATRGRHAGHSCHFVTQRAQQLSPTVRHQTSYLALFNCAASDARLLSDEWNRQELREANSLGKGHYFWTGRYNALERRKLW